MKNLIVFQILLFFQILIAHGQNQNGSLAGNVFDQKTGDRLIGVNLVLMQGEVQINGTNSEINGCFNISGISPGIYNLVISYIGYNTQIIQDIIIEKGKITEIDVKLNEKNLELIDYYEVWFLKPLYESGVESSKTIFTEEEIKRSAAR